MGVLVIDRRCNAHVASWTYARGWRLDSLWWGGRGVSNRVVQMQYRYSTATALSSWDAYAGRSIREGERGVRAANGWVHGVYIWD